MKNTYSTSLLIISCLALLSGCKKDENESVASSKVNFTIDGKSYEGLMSVTASSVAACSSSKAIVISDASATHTITLFNYKASTEVIVDPLLNGNGESCTKIWFGVTDGSASNGYFSTTGSWQVSGSNFTLTANAKVSGSNTTHTITATGKLQ